MATMDQTFRLALGEYESKNYKKSLSLLDKLLKREPTNAAAYALKALVSANSEPRYRSAPPSDDEVQQQGDLVKPNYANYCPSTPETVALCEELVSKAQKYGSKDPTTGHICALYYRHIKNYEKAASCYAQAIANGNGNSGILRDLSSCMSQLRMYTNLAKTRFQYLQSAPGYRANYSSTAVAYDLIGDPKAAVRICDQIEQIIKDKLVNDDKYEHSELAMYKGVLIAKYDSDAALKYVNELLASTETFRCLDTLGMLELRIGLLFKINSKDSLQQAQRDIRRLIKINPDNIKYYYQLFKALNIETDAISKLVVCKKLSVFYPKSDIPKFLPLTFLNPKNEHFVLCMNDYLRDKLNRGVPSVFSSLKPLYKVHSIRKVVESVVLELETENQFKIDEKQEGSNPLTLTWIKYFLAQHYYQTRELEKAMAKINEAIAITPTLIEILMYKARILKKQGKLVDAAIEMNVARELDLQDRFVNSRCTKYYLRANLIEEAIDTISIFTKNDEAQTGIRDLHVMQSVWFVSELADSLNRLFKSEFKKYKEQTNENDVVESVNDNGDIDPFHLKSSEHHSLKLSKVGVLISLCIQRYISLVQIFREYQEDQFDFHHYAFRKGTVRSYMEMISWGDGLMKQSLMGRAYAGLMDIVSFLQLYGSAEDVETIQLSLVRLGYTASTKEGKSLTKSMSGPVKKSKKDKREEGKWRDAILAYSEVDGTDVLGIQGCGSIFIDKNYKELEWVNSELKAGREAGADANFVFGEWMWEAFNNKWVAGLAAIRKMKALGDENKTQRMIERTSRFAEEADPKLATLVKMGLMRI